MRADDIWGEFALLPASPPAPDGNEREVPPTTAEAAAAFFRCETLGCSMRGTACATNWICAENGATSRPSCRGCAAGAARYRLIATLGVAAPMPSQVLVKPVRSVPRCSDCGMRKSDPRHTPALCARVQASTAAALDGGEAKRRRAERDRTRERERAEAEARQKRADAAAAREAKARARQEERAAQRAAAALLKSEERARIAAERAAVEPTERRAKAPPPSRRPIAELDAEQANDVRRRNREIKRRMRERRSAERRGSKCGVGNCTRNASMSRVGAFCVECVREARAILCRDGARHGYPVIRQLLLAPTFSAPVARADAKFADAESGESIDWIAAGIGVDSDQVVARRTGTTRHTVRCARAALGIVPRSGLKTRIAPSMTDEGWAALGIGVRTDAEIAREIGTSPDQVGYHRRRLAIPRATIPDASTSGIDWNTVDLGKRADIEIARELGVHKSSVRHHRVLRGIQPFNPRPAQIIDWDTVGLGTASDADVAKATGAHHKTVMRERQRRGIPPYATRGVRGIIDQIDWSAVDWSAETDAQIAEAFGVSRQTAARARARCATAPKSTAMALRTHDWSIVDWTRTDVDIAGDFGCRPSTIATWRRKAGAAPLTRAQSAAARVASIRRKAAELAAAHEAKQRERAQRHEDQRQPDGVAS